MKKKNFLMIISCLILISCKGNHNSTESNSNLLSSDISSVKSTLSSEEESSYTTSFQSSISSISSSESTISNESFSKEDGTYYKVTVICDEETSNYVKEGDQFKVEASLPTEGYAFIGWEDESGNIVSKDLTYEFVVSKDITLKAIYRKRDLTLTIINGEGSGVFANGEEVTISANPCEEGYEFIGWYDENNMLISNHETYSFIITSSRTLKASYELKNITITVYNGSGSGVYKYGDTVNLVADEPTSGYVFNCWMSDDGKVLSRETTYSFVATEDMYINAIFNTITYEIVVINGTTSLDNAIYNQEVTVQANDETGKVFVGWKDESNNIISTDAIYTFNVNRDITLTAVYKDVELKDFVTPNNLEELVEDVAIASLIQNQTRHINYQKNDDYNAPISLEITSYSNGLYAKGSGPYSSWSSSYPLTHIVKKVNNKFQEVKVFEGASSSYNYAKCFNIVNSVSDNDKEISLSNANEFAGCYKMISEINTLLNTFKEGSITFNTSKESNDKFSVDLLKEGDESSTMYSVSSIHIAFNAPDYYISEFTYLKNSYVKATQMTDGKLKDNATPRDTFETSFICEKGEKETLPEDKDVTPYFISSYDFKGQYYEGNTSRTFDRINNKIAKGVKINISSISIDNNSINPSTALESKTLNFVSSSNEDVISLVPNSKTQLQTLKEGKTTLTMATSNGVEVSMEVIVCVLAPASLTLDSLDKVNVNERIALNVVQTPSTSSNEVTYSVSDESIATLEYENNCVYLKGLARGYVNVTARSTLDNNIFATKTIYVANGNMSEEEIENMIQGTWYKEMSSYSKTGFTFTFENNGNLKIVDTYRGASAKISCDARWKLSDKVDSDFIHNGNNVLNLDDYYLIEVTNIEMTDSPAYWMNIHLLIAKDGSSFIYHLLAGNESASTMSGQLVKIN